MSRSIFYIAQIDDALQKLKEAFNAKAVLAHLYGKWLYIRVNVEELSSKLDDLNKMKDKVVEILGLNPEKFDVKVLRGDDLSLAFRNYDDCLEITIKKH